MSLSRRRVLALGAALPLVAAWAPHAADPDVASLRAPGWWRTEAAPA